MSRLPRYKLRLTPRAAILFHIPTTVMTFGANSSQPKMWIPPFQVMEKLQMTVFSIQECIISGIYVHATLRLYRPLYRQGLPKPMIELLLVNVVIIIMDICLLTVEYASLYVIEATMKSLVYAVKLKLEFAVLNELKGYTTTVQQQMNRSMTFCWSCGTSHPGRDHTYKEQEPSQKTKRLSAIYSPSYPSDPSDPSNTSEVPSESLPEDPNSIMKTVGADVTSFPSYYERSSVTLPDSPAQGPFRGMQSVQRAHHNRLGASYLSSASCSETELAPSSTQVDDYASSETAQMPEHHAR